MWICSHGTGHTDHHQGEPDLFLCHSALGEMVRAPIYESGACSFRVAGVRSVLGSSITAAAIRPAGLWEGGSGNDFSPAWERKASGLPQGS